MSFLPRSFHLSFFYLILLQGGKLGEGAQNAQKSTANAIFDITSILREHIFIEILEPGNFSHEFKDEFLNWDGYISIQHESFRYPQLSHVVAYTKETSRNYIRTWRNVTLDEVVIVTKQDEMDQKNWRLKKFKVTYLFRQLAAINIMQSPTSDLPTTEIWGALLHITQDGIDKYSDGLHWFVAQSWVNNPDFLQQLSMKQTGILYDAVTMAIDGIKSYLEVVDICAFSIEISIKNFITSYPLFKEMMNSLKKKNEDFVRGINPECKIYYRIKWRSSNVVSRDDIIQLRYYLLFFHFSLRWSKEAGETVILDTFVLDSRRSSNMEENIEKALQYFLREGKSVIIPEIHSTPAIRLTHFELLFTDLSFATKFLAKGNEQFDNTYLSEYGVLLRDKKRSNSSNNIDCFYQNSSHTASIWDGYFQQLDNLLNDSWKTLDDKFVLNFITTRTDKIHTETLTVSAYDISKLGKEDVEQIVSHNVSVGCFVNVRQYLTGKGFKFDLSPNGSLTRCFEAASVYIWKDNNFNDEMISLRHQKYPVDSFRKILFLLQQTVNLRDQILRLYPKREIVIKWQRLLDNAANELNIPNNVFCDELQARENMFFEGVYHFARIHDLKLISKPVVSDIVTETGWFSFLEPREELRNYSLSCPIFVSRASFVETVNKNWKSDPCIPWKGQPTEELNFDQHLGAYLDLTCTTNEKLTKDVVTFMFQLIFNKFKTVELSTTSNKTCNLSLEKVFKTNWTKIPTENAIFLVEADVNKYDIKLVKSVEKVPTTIHGIHISNWETYSSGRSGNLEMRLFSSRSVRFGLTVQNCADKLLNGFKDIKAIEKELGTNFSYLVCVEDRSPKFPYNTKEMSSYLEDHLYIKSMMQRACPNTTIYFRINVVIEKEEFLNKRLRAERYLRFIGDLTRFGNAYGINYLFRAFEGIGGNKRGPGWWKVLDADNLSNSSVYFETESEYFNRSTWIPEIEAGDSALRPDASNILAGIFGVIIGVLMVAVIVSLLLYRKLRQRILSKEAEDEFLNGIMGDDSVAEYLKIKYEANDFEIPLRKILLGAVIGVGNFGRVHEATVHDTKVAVKLTKDNASAECIKSLLMEVKLLVYLGDHINVIKFIGAYTKEIGYGIIYMVLELCEKGSLLNYLRSLDINAGASQIDTYELYKFCEEIAKGMDYISGKGIVHSDLATRNILLDSSCTVKVADLGLSKKLNEVGEYVKMSQGAVPWRWMSPETLKDKVFTVKSDIWSYGITAWEIFTLGKLPYHKEFPDWSSDFPLQLEAGLCPDKPDIASDEMYKTMLGVEPF